MPYDEDLAERIRELLENEKAITEMKMFGGLGFLVNDKMAVAASGQGGILVRIDPSEFDSVVAKSKAYPMEMRGRPMRGWVRVDAEHLRTKPQLSKWVQKGLAYARSLPS